MTQLREMLPNDSYVDDNGDVRPYADIASELDAHPVSDASIAQGMTNLETWRKEQSMVEEGEAALRRSREEALAAEALANAGVYETLEEHRKTQLALADVASLIAQYEGGEKGGYQTSDFQNRYKSKASRVESGARKNHKKVVNQILPKLFKADELEAIGIPRHDIDDEITQMRHKLKAEYGRGKEKAREQWRKQNKK